MRSPRVSKGPDAIQNESQYLNSLPKLSIEPSSLEQAKQHGSGARSAGQQSELPCTLLLGPITSAEADSTCSTTKDGSWSHYAVSEGEESEEPEMNQGKRNDDDE